MSVNAYLHVMSITIRGVAIIAQALLCMLLVPYVRLLRIVCGHLDVGRFLSDRPLSICFVDVLQLTDQV